MILAGGSLGLHSTSGRDPMSEAVHVARALDWEHPIKVQSLREEDFNAGRYRAMALHRVRAGADEEGRLTAYHHQIVAEPTSVNLPFVRDVMFKNGVDFFTTTGATDPPYKFENFKLESTNFESGVPTMVWRSVGNSHTEFARESALDELAIATVRDPVDLRRELLVDNPRTLRALELAAEIADWGTAAPEGQAHRITCSSFLNAASANVTEISLDARQRVHVDRIVYVLDCGTTINPDLVRTQVEGGLLFGLSAAAWGEVVLGDGGEIVTQNFDRYPIVRMRSVPRIEVHLIESTGSPTGVGEVAVPSVAPALANAIAALTGTRIRRLPLSKTIKIVSERFSPMPDVTITPSEDGPYIVSGPVRLVAPDGHEIEHPDPMSICRCGGSSNKPFCDGTHAVIDFDGTWPIDHGEVAAVELSSAFRDPT